MRPALFLFCTMDPRANKIGGVETHARHLLRNFPLTWDLIFVGIDEIGDLAPGVGLPLTFAGRAITFVPVARVPSNEAWRSAARLSGSTTLRFVLGGLRHLASLRALARGRLVSADLPRVEFAILPILLRMPFALTIHSDLTRIGATDSLLKRFGSVKLASEWLAFKAARRVFMVNPEIHTALVARHPELALKSDVMPVPVDSQVFRATPFPKTDIFRLAYAGRFDEVKDPGLMFETLALLAEKLEGKLEFHLIGPADPEQFPAFAAIRDFTIRHGPQKAEGVAAILREAHCGLLTSISEGMPCFLLETLASGRAFAAMHLPSFEGLVDEAHNGALVARHSSRTENAEALAEALRGIKVKIAAGIFEPETIARGVAPFSVTSVFARLFDVHQGLAGAEPKPPFTERRSVRRQPQKRALS